MSLAILKWEQHGESLAVFAVQNPATNNMINLVPAIEITNNDQASRLTAWLMTYCSEKFKMGLDVKVIDASGWRDGEPVGL
jgi:hypothetical protein